MPPCPESWSSFRAEVHVGDSGARFAGCGGDRRLRLQLRGHGAVPKVEAALPSCQWPSRGALFPGRADGSCPQRSAFLPGLWTGSASRSCCPAAAGAQGTAALRLGPPAQPGFVGRSSRTARPICGEEAGRGCLCRGGHTGQGEASGDGHALSLDGVCVCRALWAAHWRSVHLTATG